MVAKNQTKRREREIKVKSISLATNRQRSSSPCSKSRNSLIQRQPNEKYFSRDRGGNTVIYSKNFVFSGIKLKSVN